MLKNGVCRWNEGYVSFWKRPVSCTRTGTFVDVVVVVFRRNVDSYLSFEGSNGSIIYLIFWYLIYMNFVISLFRANKLSLITSTKKRIKKEWFTYVSWRIWFVAHLHFAWLTFCTAFLPRYCAMFFSFLDKSITGSQPRCNYLLFMILFPDIVHFGPIILTILYKFRGSLANPRIANLHICRLLIFKLYHWRKSTEKPHSVPWSKIIGRRNRRF